MDAKAARPSVVQYQHKMREQDQLPAGVFIVPMDAEGDMPVVHTPNGEVIVRDGDWVLRSPADNFTVLTNQEYLRRLLA